MADKLNSAPPLNPIKVGDILICEQVISNGGGPGVVWYMAYATEVDSKGIATEVRLCGHARATSAKDLKAQFWVINETRQAAAAIVAARLRSSENRFDNAEAIKAEIRLAEKLVPKGVSTPQEVPPIPVTTPSPAEVPAT